MGWVDKLGRAGLYPLGLARGNFLDDLTGVTRLSAELRMLPHAERGTAVLEDLRCLFPQLLVDYSSRTRAHAYAAGEMRWESGSMCRTE